ncbi:copper resistance protein NlpE [Taibaiella soli]|uniref:Copper resistance protein NlpE n=1 Tax=Taibaiella soli TaxID=1649169 RepID=A0A2W2A7P4_9BACT|nr:copper resistance protein NlpE [Taibaiella soli]PZF71365.1 hypothetical protein DN068_18910 [Taibaiella soli]
MTKSSAIILGLMFVFAACRNNPDNTAAHADSAKAEVGNGASAAPALQTESYSGMMPCADCSGILTDLALQHEPNTAEGTFLLRETYQGKPDTANSFNTNGTWTTSRGSASDPNVNVIELNAEGGTNGSRYYEVLPNGDLQQLDNEEKRINSQQNYTLKKQ